MTLDRTIHDRRRDMQRGTARRDRPAFEAGWLLLSRDLRTRFYPACRAIHLAVGLPLLLAEWPAFLRQSVVPRASD